ncbi:MAG: hypothetical protein H0V12_00475 [Chloroflexi bacterium]|nr:hypothetical protein [Chloroflexota bacterium]
MSRPHPAPEATPAEELPATSPPRVVRVPSVLGGGGARLGRALRRRPGRQHLTVGVGALVVLWLVLVFGRAATDAAEVSAHAAAVRAQNEALHAELDAGRREVALLQSEAFVALEARAYGLGGRGERWFRLAPGAPEPAVIVPLGADPEDAPPSRPIDDWMDLLFGD